MSFYLQLATGFLLLIGDEGSSVGGSCFAYQQRHTFLTAAHCVPANVEVIVIQEPGRIFRPAIAVEHHPTSDVALIRTEALSKEEAIEQVIERIPSDLVDGGDFLTYGYPIESNATEQEIVGRLLKGNFQRYFAYTNNLGQQYLAGEMSVATPAGHSGGPVVRADSPQRLDGIVTTNYDSYIILDHVDEVDEGGNTLRIESRRVVSYGIATMAGGLRPWLATLVSLSDLGYLARGRRQITPFPIIGAGVCWRRCRLRRYLYRL